VYHRRGTAGYGACEATSLLGKEVRSADGAAAGKIQDLIVDLGNNRVHYAVVDTPRQQVAAPLTQITISPRLSYALLIPGAQEIERRAGMVLMRVSRLISSPVQSQPGRRLGHVVDAVIEPASARVPFAVLRLDEGGKRLHPIPLDALALYTGRQGVVLTIERAQLQSHRSFTREELQAGLDDPQFIERSAAYADNLTRLDR
jgi:sporulation protein YlmC with PRC-barrel domain